MDLLKQLLDLFLHLDVHLATVIVQYGVFTYALLFLVIFCETGLVVTPFLPGDSLLFAAGTFAAKGSFEPLSLFGLIAIAAIAGDSLNYAIGSWIGPRVFSENRRWLNQKHLKQTQDFYAKYGNKTIIFARFVPIVRTLAPFVAGVGKMDYKKFISFNIIGGLAWVALFIFGGYFFGMIPAVEKNYSLVILGIILLSILPAVFHFVRAKMETDRS